MKNKGPDFKVELSYSSKVIAGVDEVGRGSIAGPIVAAAVVFNNYEKIIKKLRGINDSKVLSPTQRLEFDELIKKLAADFSIGIVEVQEIDKFGIGAANVIAFKRALDGLKKCNLALIDGRKFRGFEYEYICIEKGDSKSISIAAASIIAKVYRDALMQEIHDEIFRYDFASNKGYGSKAHYEAIKKYGPSGHHRKSFIKWYFEEQEQSTLPGMDIELVN